MRLYWCVLEWETVIRVRHNVRSQCHAIIRPEYTTLWMAAVRLRPYNASRIVVRSGQTECAYALMCVLEYETVVCVGVCSRIQTGYACLIQCEVEI